MTMTPKGPIIIAMVIRITRITRIRLNINIAAPQGGRSGVLGFLKMYKVVVGVRTELDWDWFARDERWELRVRVMVDSDSIQIRVELDSGPIHIRFRFKPNSIEIRCRFDSESTRIHFEMRISPRRPQKALVRPRKHQKTLPFYKPCSVQSVVHG